MSQCKRLVTRLQQTECRNDSHDYALCFECVKLLGHIITGLKEYTDELETQITRQDKGAPSVGGSSGEPRLAFDVDSSQARDHLEIVLSHWFAKNAHPDHHHALQGLSTERRMQTLLAWYRRFYVHLGRSENGPEILGDLDRALEQAKHAVDRKQTKIWIGNCGCGKPVMSFPKQRALVQCECGQEYDPAASRRELRVLGGAQMVTIKQAQKLGEVWGKTINPNTVKSWHRRQQIHCVFESCDGNPHEHAYLMSDLLALLRERK